MTPLEQLQEIRVAAGERQTHGLDDGVIEGFLERDPLLSRVIADAHQLWTFLAKDGWKERLSLPEAELAAQLQAAYVNFYPADNVNPYVALAARGPWLVTTHGAVLHDNGGYGMLGQGHAPEAVLDAMHQPWVMANVMTPSLSHARFAEALRAEVGQRRADGCPFDRFICMNSGSEAVSVAARITDIHAKRMTDPGARYAGKRVKFMALRGGFHGRTGRPSQVSDSTLATYRAHLKSYAERDNLFLVTPNDLDDLRAAFARADAEGVFIEAMFMEPVMGEGNPGQAVTRAFYDLARQLTAERDVLLIVDSIQAGLRGTGYLSLVDYPGFEDCVPPDMETWSKALNAGQYPLSVLGLGKRAAQLYVRGVYGNTMTTNPRALEVGVAVLKSLTPELRANIVARGNELVQKLGALAEEFPGVVLGARGTGLLLAVHLDPEKAPVLGTQGIEVWCRKHGLGVIHGGKNALRFTPHFAITSAECDLIVTVVRQALRAHVGLAALDEVRSPVRAEAH